MRMCAEIALEAAVDGLLPGGATDVTPVDVRESNAGGFFPRRKIIAETAEEELL